MVRNIDGVMPGRIGTETIQFFGDAFSIRFGAAYTCDARAFSCEPHGNGLADTPPRSGNNCRLIFESHHVREQSCATTRKCQRARKFSEFGTLMAIKTAMTPRSFFTAFCILSILGILSHGAIASPTVVVSVPDQKLVVVDNGQPVAQFPISTSRYGLGDRPGSYATPLGRLEIAAKIGAEA